MVFELNWEITFDNKYWSYVIFKLQLTQYIYSTRSQFNNLNSYCTGLSKKMDGIWNRYNLKSTGRIYTFAS